VDYEMSFIGGKWEISAVNYDYDDAVFHEIVIAEFSDHKLALMNWEMMMEVCF